MIGIIIFNHHMRGGERGGTNPGSPEVSGHKIRNPEAFFRDYNRNPETGTLFCDYQANSPLHTSAGAQRHVRHS